MLCMPGSTADTYRASVAEAFEEFQLFFYVKEDLGTGELMARAGSHLERPLVSGIPCTVSVSHPSQEPNPFDYVKNEEK